MSSLFLRAHRFKVPFQGGDWQAPPSRPLSDATSLDGAPANAVFSSLETRDLKTVFLRVRARVRVHHLLLFLNWFSFSMRAPVLIRERRRHSTVCCSHTSSRSEAPVSRIALELKAVPPRTRKDCACASFVHGTCMHIWLC